MTPHRAADAILYEDEAIRVGLLLFPGKLCPSCETLLPANGDYFAPDPRQACGIVSCCRRCRRERERERSRRRRASVTP